MAAYTWNREKQMFVALGKEFDMLSERFVDSSVNNMYEYLANFSHHPPDYVSD